MNAALVAAALAATPAARAPNALLARAPSDDAPTHPQLPKGSRVLVTGGAGFIGFHLTKRLHADGMHVTVLDNMYPYYSSRLKKRRWDLLSALEGVSLVHGDMCNDTLLHQMQEKYHFTHVASLAGQAGVRYSLMQPKAYTHNNVHCFLSLLEMLRYNPKVKLVYASSSSVYGANTKVPFSESDRVDIPESIYAVTKKTDEQMAHVYHRLYNVSVTGCRFFTVYGPWGRPDMAYFSMAQRMRKNQSVELYGHGSVQRDFTYVDDIVDGVSAALGLGASEEIFNLGNHRVVNVSRFVEVLEGHMGLKAKKVLVGMEPGDVPLTYADTSHARELLGYEPSTTIEVGLERFVKWINSSEYRDEYAQMEFDGGKTDILHVNQHLSRVQTISDDAGVGSGTARCMSSCVLDKGNWETKCVSATLKCASCAECGIPGEAYADERQITSSGFVAFSRRAPSLQPLPEEENVQEEGKAQLFADAKGEPLAFSPPACTKGAHVVFIGAEAKSGIVMRDVVMSTVLKEVFQTHSSVAYIGGMTPQEQSNHLLAHFRKHGEPAVCITVQKPSLEANRVCREHGALVLLDCVDNPQCAQAEGLAMPAVKTADALLVQTMTHRQVLRSQGLHAAVWPHPHGNFMNWSPSGPPRDKIANVGLLVSDPKKSMPDNQTLQALADVCCDHGAKLFLVFGGEDGNVKPNGPPPLRVVSPSKAGWQERCRVRQQASHASPRLAKCAASGAEGASTKLAVDSPPADEEALAARLREMGQPLEKEAAVLNQRALYQSSGDISGQYALGTIDVALLWPERGAKKNGPFIANNKPPTALSWWFSHGTPVLAHSMNAYLEAGQRVGYPDQLLRVDSPSALDDALCKIAPPAVRARLQRLSKYGGSLASPTLSANNLLVEVCGLVSELNMSRHDVVSFTAAQRPHAAAGSSAINKGTESVAATAIDKDTESVAATAIDKGTESVAATTTTSQINKVAESEEASPGDAVSSRSEKFSKELQNAASIAQKVEAYKKAVEKAEAEEAEEEKAAKERRRRETEKIAEAEAAETARVVASEAQATQAAGAVAEAQAAEAKAMETSELGTAAAEVARAAARVAPPKDEKRASSPRQVLRKAEAQDAVGDAMAATMGRAGAAMTPAAQAAAEAASRSFGAESSEEQATQAAAAAVDERPTRLEDGAGGEDTLVPSQSNCTWGDTRCGLDLPQPRLRGSFAAVADDTALKSSRCSHVVYTVAFQARAKVVKLHPAPLGAEGCAFAFVYSGTSVEQDSTPRQQRWSVLEVSTDDLPWPMEAHRRNSRVLKLLPHLFFPAPVIASVYLDSDNTLGGVNVSQVIRSMLTECGAGFAAQAHKTRSVHVMQEFRAILDNENTVEPDAVKAQERQYRRDQRYMAALKAHGGVGIDGVLLLRRTDDPMARRLSEAWMHAYLHGGDRDQPAFSYAFEKAVMAPCRAAAIGRRGAARRDLPPGSCGLSCGQGFANLVGHAASNDCAGLRVGGKDSRSAAHTHLHRAAVNAELERPRWSTSPPEWLCRSEGLANMAAP